MTMVDMLSRIQQIRGQLGLDRTAGRTSSNEFAAALAGAQGGLDVTGTGAGTTGADVVADATRYLGVPYVFGGTDPRSGLDCSGLVQRVYGDLGFNLPRTAAEQAKMGQPVASLAQARPGDLVAFDSPVDHIGIYAGDGMMVVAPHAGDQVKLQRVYKTPTAIRRILPDTDTAVTATSLRPAALTGLPGVPYANLFSQAASRYGLPPQLLAAVGKVESGYNPKAVSPAGALGLMQLLPSTAAGLGVNPTDPAQAIDGAARLLSRNLREFGSLPLALAAYNAGAGAVHKYGGIPPYAQTQGYVQKVQAAMAALGSKG
jgi:soluble lytic murein transglycosylase-like protein